MLIPARMRKIVVVGLTTDRDRVLSVLHDLRAVQVEHAGKEVLAYFAAEKGGAAEKEITDELQRFRTLVSSLPPVPIETKTHFPSTESLLAAAHAVTIDADVHALKRREDERVTVIHNLTETQGVLQEFSFFNEDLSLLVAKSVFSFFTTLPSEKFAPFRSEVSALSKDAYISRSVATEDGKSVRVVVVVPRDHAEAFAKITQRHGARLYAVPSEFPGTPSQALAEIGARLTAARKDLEDIHGALLRISQEWYGKILPLEEGLAIEGKKAEVVGLLGRSSSSFALEGWVTSKSLAGVEVELRRVTSGRCHVFALEGMEGAPTLLENPKGVSLFEFFIKFYSLPQSWEIDPTLVFAIVFPIFFGLMLGDAGYGVVILGLALWLMWRIGNPNAGPTIFPKFLVKFITVIVPPWVIKQLARMLVPCALISIAIGVLFDGYFGFTLSEITFGRLALPATFHYSPMTHVGQLLLIAGYIGLALVTLGLVFGAVNAYIHRNMKHLAGKISWILLAWGVTLVGLDLIHFGATEHLSALAPTVHNAGIYEGMAIAGVLGIIIFEGGLAAVELPTIVTHILSYTRLIGILFSSIILALVIDTISIGLMHNPSPSLGVRVGFFVAGLVLLIFGQLFNLVLGIFEPSIQGIRLLYVEHFSKFYSGNGKAFSPFGSRRKYTRPQFLEAHPELSGRN